MLSKTAGFQLRGGDYDEALERLYFDYKLEGEAALKPNCVLDDGQHTYIMYPADGRFRELPTLMIRTSSSKNPELVNFRVMGNKYIVDPNIWKPSRYRMVRVVLPLRALLVDWLGFGSCASSSSPLNLYRRLFLIEI